MGKNFVCSDIHGMKGSYEEALKRLSQDDILYILGDATDRGDEGIEILIDILEHSGEQGDKPRIEYILGNHDLMLIENMETIIKHKIRLKDKSDFNLWTDFVDMCYEFFESRLAGDGNPQEIYESMLSKIDWLKGVSYDEMRVLSEHIYNDGDLTIFKLLNMKEQGQEKLHEFLENCFIQKTMGIVGKKFVFTHATPIPKLTIDGQGITLKQARSMIKGESTIEKDKKGIYPYITARGDKAEKEWGRWMKKGYHTICGHTPKRNQPSIDKKMGRIIVDTGVVSNGDLALINIDDGELEMIGTKGTIKGHYKEYKPEKYGTQRMQVKDFFESIPVIQNSNSNLLNSTQQTIVGQKKGQSGQKDDIYSVEPITTQMSDLTTEPSGIKVKNDNDIYAVESITTQMSDLTTEPSGIKAKNDDDIYAVEPITAQMKDLRVGASYVSMYKQMVDRMENGENPTEEDIKVLQILSAEKLDSSIYSDLDEQTRINMLNWGGLAPQIDTVRDEILTSNDDIYAVEPITTQISVFSEYAIGKGTINSKTVLKDQLRTKVDRDIKRMKNNERGINHGE